MRRPAWLLLLLAAAVASAQPDGGNSVPRSPDGSVDVARLPPFGYTPATVTDRLGRTVEYYISGSGGSALPLVLFIHGSGCASVFGLTPDGKVYGGLQNLVLGERGESVRVMVVEKPGVNFADAPPNPGTAEGCPEAFLFEHTAERWTEALRAALADALARPAADTGIDASQVLVMGHSEGADMAAHLTDAINAERPGAVTHTALLAGAGITQLFDMIHLAWAERSDDEPLEDRSARVQSVLDTWDAIAADPDSISAFAWGHPHRRWSGFLSKSPAASLERIARESPDTRLFLAHGTEDASSPIESFDAALARVLVAGGKPEVRRIPGADHALAIKGQEAADGLRGVMSEAVDWFLESDR